MFLLFFHFSKWFIELKDPWTPMEFIVHICLEKPTKGRVEEGSLRHLLWAWGCFRVVGVLMVAVLCTCGDRLGRNR